jgi:hypothetical protein
MVNAQELTAIIYRTIRTVTEENYAEDKIPSYVEMAERVASDVLLYLQSNSNIK